MLRLGHFRASFGLLLLAALDMLLDLSDVFLVRLLLVRFPLLLRLVMLDMFIDSLGFVHLNMFIHNLLMHGLLFAVMMTLLPVMLVLVPVTVTAVAGMVILLQIVRINSEHAFDIRLCQVRL